MDVIYEQEYARCKRDFVYFVEKYIKIIHPKQGLINFNLYDYQKRLAGVYDKERFVIFKKFRQGGFTTFTVMWFLWRAMFYENQHIFVASKTDREAVDIGNLVTRFLDQLPEWLIPRMKKNNQHEKAFCNTDSLIHFSCIQATRSRAFTHLYIDEAAFMPNMEESWKCVYPTLSTGGKAFVGSTPNGLGNWFSEMYLNAVEKKNAFHVFETHYTEHPDYQNDKWVDEMKKNLGPKGWQQEVEANFVYEKTEENTRDLTNQQLIIRLQDENISPLLFEVLRRLLLQR